MFRSVLWLSGSLIFLVSATVSLFHQTSDLNLTEFAEIIENSDQMAESYPSQEMRIRKEVADRPGCRRAVARSRVTAILFALQSRVASAGGINRDDPLLSETRLAIDYALMCNPLDGNLWLLSGWFAKLSDDATSPFTKFLEMSVATAPLEGKVLEKRWTLLAPVLGQLGIQNVASLAQDLANFLALGKIGSAASVVVILRDTGSWQMADAALSLVSDNRRAVLAEAVTPKQGLEPDSKKYRQFEFTPVGPVRRE